MTGPSAAGPDFLGIGPPRCGTTTLYERLRAHPDLWLPPIKELHYWDIERSSDDPTHGRRGRLRFGMSHTRRSRTRDDLEFMVRFAAGRRSDEWYARLFPSRQVLTQGEITPSYCALDPATVVDIRTRFPDLKVLLMLRDPIERVWSAAAKRLARQDGRQLHEVSEADLRAYFDRPRVRAFTDYPAILERWRSVFDPHSLFVGFLDDMTDRPQVFFSDLARHLGVESAPLLRADVEGQPVNTTAGFRSDVPERWERHLAGQYVEVSESIADEFGGPAVAWYERARASLAA